MKNWLDTPIHQSEIEKLVGRETGEFVQIQEDVHVSEVADLQFGQLTAMLRYLVEQLLRNHAPIHTPIVLVHRMWSSMYIKYAK